MIPVVVGLGVGLFFFFHSFRRLKFLRHVQGLATSRVRSAAVGIVELSGFARTITPLQDPIYRQPCAYFRIQVKEKRGSGKSSHWVTIYTNNSDAVPFFIEDSTGRAMIFPMGAELHFSFQIRLTSSVLGRTFGQQDPISHFLSQVAGGWKTVRLEADILREGEPLFVLGHFGSTLPMSGGPKPVTIHDIAKELKNNPEKLKTLDLNKDGVVDPKEWDDGLAELVRQRTQTGSGAEPETFPVVRKREGNPFVLADSEKNLLGKTHVGLWAELLLGIGLILFCVKLLVNLGFNPIRP